MRPGRRSSAGGSTTTARASTRGCSRSAGPRAGRSRATASPSIRASRRCWPRSQAPPGLGSGRDRDRRLRRRHVRLAASGDGDGVHARSTSESPARDARVPGADPGAARRWTRISCRRFRAGSQRAAPRDCCAQPHPTGSASRSRSRTARPARFVPRSAPFWTRSGSTGPASGRVPICNSRNEVVGELAAC